MPNLSWTALLKMAAPVLVGVALGVVVQSGLLTPGQLAQVCSKAAETPHLPA